MKIRETILALLYGQKKDRASTFSGLIHITADGLEREKLSFPEIHLEAGKLAKAAASTYRLAGFPSAALPLDICVEAEALGAEIDFRAHADFEFPRPARPVFASVKDIVIPADALHRARLPIVLEAISLLKQDIGKQIVISGIIPGPFTLLTLISDPPSLFMQMKRDPEIVITALFHLSSFLAQVARAYRRSGADFVTVHEMGGSPGFLGPARFETFVLPALKDLIANLTKPRVLSVCGDTNHVMHLLAQSGADAISVDQLNDLAASRAVLPDTLLFGNIDPLGVLARGSLQDVRDAVKSAIRSGVDAIWPACDLALRTPIENLRTMITGEVQ